MVNRYILSCHALRASCWPSPASCRVRVASVRVRWGGWVVGVGAPLSPNPTPLVSTMCTLRSFPWNGKNKKNMSRSDQGETIGLLMPPSDSPCSAASRRSPSAEALQQRGSGSAHRCACALLTYWWIAHVYLHATLRARLYRSAPPCVAPLVPPYATLGGACYCWHPKRRLMHPGTSAVGEPATMTKLQSHKLPS
jgi:hypothetical protein